jgi:hypothetical protein
VAAIVLGRGLRRSGSWAHLAVAGRLGLIAIAATAVLVTAGFGEVAGLVRRLWVLVVFGWPVVPAAAPGRASCDRGGRGGSPDGRQVAVFRS